MKRSRVTDYAALSVHNYLREDGNRKKTQSLAITVCYQSASLVLPNGIPRDGFFYPTLPLITYSYIHFTR